VKQNMRHVQISGHNDWSVLHFCRDSKSLRRGILGHRSEEVKNDWIKLHNEEVRRLFSPTDIMASYCTFTTLTQRLPIIDMQHVHAYNKTGNVRINLTLRRVRITVIAVGKQ
jgi:hypothetical protein